jgi:hypothetical protein
MGTDVRKVRFDFVSNHKNTKGLIVIVYPVIDYIVYDVYFTILICPNFNCLFYYYPNMNNQSQLKGMQTWLIVV